ncbi:hypothetical protein HNR43_001209 [Anoxybacillus mongoliensis]|uniref:Transposase n=1 Tax=Anoxybacillus mongoliensis TaxID=452565 RepID=A0A7W8JE29_9BACL|nr:hypothetical protein [Anoxybacillus mongoliensis]
MKKGVHTEVMVLRCMYIDREERNKTSLINFFYVGAE